MDLLDAWAVKIAEAAAPEEVVLAPETVRAYIAGGADRADLFRQNQRGAPGGFDFGMFQVVLPYLLQGLQIASPVITTILSSALSELFLEFMRKKLLKEGKGSSQEEQALRQLPDDPYEPLKRLDGILRQELDKAKVAENKAECITYHTIQAILENPEGTREFLQRLPPTDPARPTKQSLMKKLFKRN